MKTMQMTAGGSSFLLDVVAVIVIIILIIAFLLLRHRYKTEERQLKEKIEAFGKEAERPADRKESDV